MARYHFLGIALLGFALFGSNSVLAGESAEQLYKKAMEHLNKNEHAKACPLFAESFRLDSKPGTLFALALCESESGHVATGRAYYEWFLRLYNDLSEREKKENQKRKKIAHEQVELLAKDVPSLTLILPAERPRGTRVFLDGKEVETAAMSKPIPVDPGERMVRVEVPGRTAWTDVIEVKEKGKNLEVKLSIPSESPDQPKGAIVPAPEHAPELVNVHSTSNRRRTAAIVVGGVGIAGSIAGGIMGGLAMSRKSLVDKECIGTNCTAAGKEAGNTGRMLANASTVGFSVGLAGVATGVVLWLTAPKSQDANAPNTSININVLGVGSDGAVLGLRGAF